MEALPASMLMTEHNLGLQAGAEDNVGSADFARAKRYKKVIKLLNSNRTRKAISALKARSKQIMVALVLVHVAVFATTRILLNTHQSLLDQVRPPS
jgi:hypothetical protein